MVSLLSNPLHKFDVDQRNRLYYGQFEYSARFFQKEINVIRKLDYEAIEETIGYRNSWRSHEIITEDIRHQLHATANHLLSLQNPYKTMISMSWLYFYTNHPEDIDRLANFSPLQKLGATSRVEITHGRDTIGLKNPCHAYRTYVRNHKTTEHEREYLRDFAKHNEDELRLSPGLKEFLHPKTKTFWMMDYYFIDHNDMKIATALALMNPKLVRKTLPIVRINK